jgi:hypothetical protein
VGLPVAVLITGAWEVGANETKCNGISIKITEAQLR